MINLHDLPCQTKRNNVKGYIQKYFLSELEVVTLSKFICVLCTIPLSSFAAELSTCATVQELTRTKQGPFTLEEHALQEDKWTIDEIAQSLELCTALLLGEPARKKLKTEHPGETAVVCGDKW